MRSYVSLKRKLFYEKPQKFAYYSPCKNAKTTSANLTLELTVKIGYTVNSFYLRVRKFRKFI